MHFEACMWQQEAHLTEALFSFGWPSEGVGLVSAMSFFAFFATPSVAFDSAVATLKRRRAPLIAEREEEKADKAEARKGAMQGKPRSLPLLQKDRRVVSRFSSTEKAEQAKNKERKRNQPQPSLETQAYSLTKFLKSRSNHCSPANQSL